MILRLFAALMLFAAVLTATSAARAQAADPATAEYRLGAGDKVRVIVFDEPSLSGEFAVSGSGQVSLPLIGEINAMGVSVPEFQAEIERLLLDGYLKNPRVSVEVLNYRPFYILGEVKKPGEYPYTNGLTVMNAVARAEGFTYRANTKRVFIKRAGETQERETSLTSTTIVSPGDTVRIVERFF